MTRSTAWKSLERQAARTLGGKRICRGADFGEPGGDVSHPLLTIECKYRKQISNFLKDGIKQAQGYDTTKIPVLILKERGQRGAFAMLKMTDLQDILSKLSERD